MKVRHGHDDLRKTDISGLVALSIETVLAAIFARSYAVWLRPKGFLVPNSLESFEAERYRCTRFAFENFYYQIV